MVKKATIEMTSLLPFLCSLKHRYASVFIVFLALVVMQSGCTFYNKETFEIQADAVGKHEAILQGIETYFKELGFQLERKTDYFYPEKRKNVTYFLGHSRGPSPLYSSYSYLALRLEATDTLYIDWIKISDLREKARPGEFDKIHKKIADDLMARVGVAVKFTHLEQQ